MKEKIKRLSEKCFTGDITISKAMLWLAGAVCLLGGIVYGLKTAPMTHGMMIGSNNGNNSGNGCGCASGKEEDAEEEKVSV